MKLLVRFFLPLCVFLLSGYSQLHAQIYQHFIACSPIKAFGQLEYLHFKTTPNGLVLVVKSASSDKEKDNDKIRATDNEKEEEDCFILKKYAEAATCFIALLFTLSPGSFWRYVKQRLVSSTHFSCFSDYTYLLFRMIRI